MYTIKLASLLPDDEVDFVYDVDDALFAVGEEEYQDLVPVVILRSHELDDVPPNIDIIKEELEEVRVQGL